MAKRRKPYRGPLNMSDDLADMTALVAGCTAIDEVEDLTGVFTVMVAKGHYDFIIDEEIANEMIQALRQFLRGDSKSLLDEA